MTPDQETNTQDIIQVKALTEPERPVFRPWCLLAIHFINSCSPSRIFSLDVSRGAALFGGNGHGKTSLLNVVSLFCGENPGRLSKRDANNASFVSHYLHSPGSYIIFEYSRETPDDICMSVFHSKPGDNSIQQIFVRSAYDPTLFITDDKKTYLPAQLLRERLSLRKIQCSAHHNMTDYRTILQAKDTKNFKDAKTSRSILAATKLYSITPAKSSLAGIERIIHAIFQRVTSFEDIAIIVARDVQENSAHPEHNTTSLQTSRDDLHAWLRDYRAYQEVMKEEPTFKAADKHDAERTLKKTELSNIISRLEGFILHAEDQSRTINDKIQETDAKINKINTEDVRRLSDLQRDEALLLSEKTTLNAAAEAFRSQKEVYAKSTIVQDAQEYDNRQISLDRIQSLKTEQATIEKNAGNIRVEYDKLKNEERERLQKQKEDLSRARREEEMALNATRQNLSEQKDVRSKAIEAEHDVILTNIQTQLNDARENQGIAEERARNPVLPPEIESNLHAAETALQASQTAYHQTQSDKIKKQQAVMDAKEQARQAEDALKKAKKHVHTAEEGLTEARDFLQGPEHSIINLVRRERPELLDPLTRLVSPEILRSTHLSPTLNDTQDTTLFGISLDLSSLQPHPSVDPVKAEEAVATAENTLKKAHANLEQAEKEHSLAQRMVKTTNTHLRTAEAQESTARNHYTEDQKTHNRAKQMRAEAREQALETARANLAEAKKTTQALTKTYQTALASKTTALDTLHDHFAKQIKNAESASHQAQQQINAQFIAIERKSSETIGMLNARLESQLKSEGIDTETLAKITAEIDKIKKRLDALNALEHTIAEWRRWSLTEPAKQTERETRLSELARQIPELHTHIEQVETEIATKRHDLTLKRNKLTQSDSEIKQRSAKIQTLLQTLDEEKGNAEPFWREQDDETVLAVRAGQLKSEILALDKNLAKYLRKLSEAFHLYPNSSVCSYYTDGSYETDADGNPLTGFRIWYESRHAETRLWIINSYEILSKKLTTFHTQISRFCDGVRKFSRETAAEMKEASVFESLTDLTIKIEPKLDKMAYWEKIESIVNTSKISTEDNHNELPDASFCKALEDLLAIWHSNKNIQTDLVSLIDISGSVRDKGRLKKFSSGKELTSISSNGLSYLILTSILTAFTQRIRKKSPTVILWSIDEIRDLDIRNTNALIRMLRKRNIEIFCAFTEHDRPILQNFKHIYKIIDLHTVKRVPGLNRKQITARGSAIISHEGLRHV